MLVDLPGDVQEHVFDIYKAGIRVRYTKSPHCLADVVRASCGNGADFVFHFITTFIRHPPRKAGFALVLTGGFADTIALFLCKVAGEGNWTTCEARCVAGRFNGHMRDKRLIVLTGPLTDNVIGPLNMLLTDQSIVVEEPYQNAVCIPSHHRVVLTSPVQITDSNSRRFHTVHCREVDGFPSGVLENLDLVASFRRHLDALCG